MTIQEVLRRDNKFKYQLLSRLQQDCRYFLGNGRGHTKRLWALSVNDQISYMREIWNSFKFADKPEWLTIEAINKYEQDMLKLGEIC